MSFTSENWRVCDRCKRITIVYYVCKHTPVCSVACTAYRYCTHETPAGRRCSNSEAIALWYVEQLVQEILLRQKQQGTSAPYAKCEVCHKFTPFHVYAHAGGEGAIVRKE